MSTSDSFKEYIVREVLREIDGITARSMFGGYGIYRYGIFFALIASGTLYFKTDGSNLPDYQAYDSKPFIYISPRDKKTTMTYYQVPEEIMEDIEAMKEWVEKSYQVALTKKKLKPTK